MKSAKKIAIGFLLVASALGISLTSQAASPNNSTPVLFAPDASSTAIVSGKLMTFTLVGFDLDTTDVLSYSASNLPVGASLNPTTGLFTWTPTASQVGSFNANFTVSDGIDSNTVPVTLTVNSSVVNPPSSDDHDDDDKKEEKNDRREDRRKNRDGERRTDRRVRN